MMCTTRFAHFKTKTLVNKLQRQTNQCKCQLRIFVIFFYLTCEAHAGQLNKRGSCPFNLDALTSTQVFQLVRA